MQNVMTHATSYLNHNIPGNAAHKQIHALKHLQKEESVNTTSSLAAAVQLDCN